jgi:hypothetical protein
MTKQGQVNQFYGPFYRDSEDDKWHWIKECPSFPVSENPQTKISNTIPEDLDLCDECMDLDKELNHVNNNKVNNRKL